jgi:hypothetical protein
MKTVATFRGLMDHLIYVLEWQFPQVEIAIANFGSYVAEIL